MSRSAWVRIQQDAELLYSHIAILRRTEPIKGLICALLYCYALYISFFHQDVRRASARARSASQASPDDINDMPFTTLLSAQIAEW